MGLEAHCPLPATPTGVCCGPTFLCEQLGPPSPGLGEVTPTGTQPTVEETEAQRFGN